MLKWIKKNLLNKYNGCWNDKFLKVVILEKEILKIICYYYIVFCI